MSAKNKNKVVERKAVPTVKEEVKPIESAKAETPPVEKKEVVKVEETAKPDYSSVESAPESIKPKKKEESLHNKIEDANGRMVYETNKQYMEAEKAKGNI